MTFMGMRQRVLIMFITVILFIESVIILRKDVNIVWLIIIILGYFLMIKEIYLENSYEKLYMMSEYDVVTGVPNRRYFINEMDKIIKKSQKNKGKIAVIFIDLDNFKCINDTYGHYIGDKVLVEFCNVLSEFFYDKSLISRFGGDEFVVAKYGIKDLKEIKDILDRLYRTLDNPIIIENREIYCAMSIGVSVYPTDGEDTETLLTKADMTMYKAKSDGKNKYKIYDRSTLDNLNKDNKLEMALKSAINNNEIYLVYQPKVNSITEELEGYECLVRWNSKELGNVSSTKFIPIAESTGLIVILGKYIIDCAFQNCKELILKTNRNFKISITLSYVQIRDEKLVDYIKSKLKEYNLDSNYIEFEIAESVIMKSFGKNIKVLNELKALGVSIALDDFGAGYSSLEYLRLLPIDVLKIDNRIISQINKDENINSMIESIVELSHTLNLRVVAEGVETRIQQEYLRSIGCDIIQGFYYNTPNRLDMVSQMIIIKQEKELI